jgi:hypothetical protein
VALWKDLARDPLVIRTDLAQHLLAESVAQGVETHAGEPFTLSTIEIPIVTDATGEKVLPDSNGKDGTLGPPISRSVQVIATKPVSANDPMVLGENGDGASGKPVAKT